MERAASLVVVERLVELLHQIIHCGLYLGYFSCRSCFFSEKRVAELQVANVPKLPAAGKPPHPPHRCITPAVSSCIAICLSSSELSEGSAEQATLTQASMRIATCSLERENGLES